MLKDTEFKDKVFVVFGATGGIGSAVFHELVNNKAKVYPVARNQDKLKCLSENLNPDNYHVIKNIDFESIELCLDEAKDYYGKIDGVVNCFGSLILKPAHLISYQEWLDTVNINLTSSFAIIKYSSKLMGDNGYGSVVLISSAAALIGLSNHEAIASAKAGIIGLVKSAAATYSKKGLRINCVAPGLVETPLTEKLTSNESVIKKSERMHPIGRIGRSEDVSSAICWLLSPQNSWITGEVIRVDGGLSAIKN